MSHNIAQLTARTSKRLCRYKNVSFRTLSTSRPLFAEESGKVPENAEEIITKLKELPEAVDISQIALEAGSNSGLAFVGNNIMGAFGWLKDWLPSFGSSEVIWNDTVIPKLTHFYIPSIYELAQYYSGAPWFVVIGIGTLTLRTLLLPLTRRTMRMPLMMGDFIPKFQGYSDLISVLKQNKQYEKAEKVTKWQREFATANKGGSLMVSFIGSGFVMLTINRGLRHLSRLTPLMEGGFGPFLDMTVNSNSSVGLYCLPICVVTALGTTLHMNFRERDWYNPRLYVVGVPVGGILVYLMSKMAVVMCLHYAISSWFSTTLTLIQHKNNTLLGLPPPFKKLAPPEKITLTQETPRSEPNITESLEEDYHKIASTSQDFSDLSPKTFHEHDQKSDLEILEELTGTSSDKTMPRSASFETPYTPIFKLGSHWEESKKDNDNIIEYERRNPTQAAAATSSGFVQKVAETVPRLQLRKRFRAWYFRQKLMRHGKKGKMTLFLEDAPQEMNFMKEPIQLTTEVTPGLKRYVLRRQYPMNTLEEVERKVSFLERVQGPRW